MSSVIVHTFALDGAVMWMTSVLMLANMFGFTLPPAVCLKKFKQLQLGERGNTLHIKAIY